MPYLYEKKSWTILKALILTKIEILPFQNCSEIKVKTLNFDNTTKDC